MNTTDLMITALFDDAAIAHINKETGLDFKQLTDGALAGGPKILAFEAFGTCVRSLDTPALQRLTAVFRATPFKNPEYAILLIDCDSSEAFNGKIDRVPATSSAPS